MSLPLTEYKGSLYLLIGKRVRTLRKWVSVPLGTEGVIDDVYDNDNAIMVAWDLPDRPLPPGYCQYDDKPAIVTNILRDGFNRNADRGTGAYSDERNELYWLELISV